jgi:hypothetical protein
MSADVGNSAALQQLGDNPAVDINTFFILISGFMVRSSTRTRPSDDFFKVLSCTCVQAQWLAIGMCPAPSG